MNTGNEARAKEFIDFINNTFDKRKDKFNYHLQRLDLLGNAEAEDIFYETIIKIDNRIKEAGFIDSAFITYFDRAAKNNLANFNKKARSLKTIGLDSSTDTEDSDLPSFNVDITSYEMQDYESERRDEMVDEALVKMKEAEKTNALQAFDGLPFKFKEVLIMRSNGLKYREIERVLGLTEAQTKMRIKTARDLIKSKLLSLNAIQSKIISEPEDWSEHSL